MCFNVFSFTCSRLKFRENSRSHCCPILIFHFSIVVVSCGFYLLGDIPPVFPFGYASVWGWFSFLRILGTHFCIFSFGCAFVCVVGFLFLSLGDMFHCPSVSPFDNLCAWLVFYKNLREISLCFPLSIYLCLIVF